MADRSDDSRRRLVESLRRSAAPITVGVILAVLATDWPLQWHWWIEHPVIAAFVPGLLIVLLTLAVVDTYLRHREARRWQAIGHAAGGEFRILFSQFFVVMFELLGLDMGSRFSADVAFQCEPAAKRAAELLLNPIPIDPYVIVFDPAGYRAVVEERLPVLVRDELWRDCSIRTLLILSRDQQAAIARWAGTFGIVGDEKGFNQVAGSVAVLDRVNALLEHMVVVQDAEVEVRPFDAQHQDASIVACVDHWIELMNELERQRKYWIRRQSLGSTAVSHDDLPLLQLSLGDERGSPQPAPAGDGDG